MDLPIQWEGWKHHHWLLIRLAMKTGDVTRIWSSYGEGGLAGLMGLSEEVHSPDDFRVPRVCCVPVVISSSLARQLDLDLVWYLLHKPVFPSICVLCFLSVHTCSAAGSDLTASSSTSSATGDPDSRGKIKFNLALNMFL